MKILITGGLGFIGSNFCRYIIAERPSDELVNIDKEGIGANPANRARLLGAETWVQVYVPFRTL